MHERSVARNLLNIVLEQFNALSASKKQSKVVLIRIVIGEFTMIHDELLTTAFCQLSKSTVADGASIEIIHYPLKGSCQKCQQKFKLNKEEFKCPNCGSRCISIISGNELFVKDIEITNFNPH